MAKNYNYPIILGPGFRKGLCAGRSPLFKGGADLFIVRLNKDLRTGDKIYKEDLDSVEVMIHFTDKRSVKETIDVLTEMLLKWKEDDDGQKDNAL